MDKKNIVYLKPSELTPYFNNPRKNDDAVVKIAESIQSFGFQNPIIADKSRIIIAGHTRWKAALKLELKSVPVIITDLPEDKAKAYRIADNRMGEFAEWDWEALDAEIEDFDQELKDMFDFEFPDITIEDGLIDDDEVPEVTESICNSGDLWKLGNHRLLCGDATKKEDVEKLMDGDKINMVMTSPPYWVGKEYETQNSEKDIDDFVIDSLNALCDNVNIDFSRIIINTGTGMATRVGENKSRVILLLDKWINGLHEKDWYLRSIRHWIKGG